MASSPYEELRAAQLCKVSNALAWQRTIIVGGFNLVIFLTLACAGVDALRLALVTLFGLGAFAWQLARWWAMKRGFFRHDAGVYRTLVGMIVLQSGTLALTGGVFSPFLPLLFPLLVSVLLSFGRGRRSRRVAGLVVLIALALAAVSLSPWEAAAPLPRPHHCLLACASLLFGVYILYLHVLAVTDAYSNAGEALGRVREDLLAQAGERARSLELVSAKVAHELKNPLAAVKGLVQLLDRSAPDARTHERLEVIAGEVTRMEAILRDYLSFSRPLEALRPAPVAVGPLVDDVIAVLEGRAEGAGVALAREGDPVSLVGDGRRLKEALLNLLTNAIEATPTGGSVTVQLRREGEGGELVIRDTGRGIPEHLLSRVGSPFFTTREGGTGLGVALARAIIQQHGGTLHYRSEPGRGTTATVSLPRRPPCAPPPSLAPAERARIAARRTARRPPNGALPAPRGRPALPPPCPLPSRCPPSIRPRKTSASCPPCPATTRAFAFATSAPCAPSGAPKSATSGTAAATAWSKAASPASAPAPRRACSTSAAAAAASAPPSRAAATASPASTATRASSSRPPSAPPAPNSSSTISPAAPSRSPRSSPSTPSASSTCSSTSTTPPAPSPTRSPSPAPAASSSAPCPP